MTTKVTVVHVCDVPGCPETISAWHWTALGAQSGARATMRRLGWTVVSSPHDNNKGDRRHFCSGHRDRAAWTRYPRHDTPDTRST